jgi:hypothetical protein
MAGIPESDQFNQFSDRKRAEMQDADRYLPMILWQTNSMEAKSQSASHGHRDTCLWLTSCSTVLLEKLTVVQQVKKFCLLWNLRASFLLSWGGVRLSPLGTLATNWPILLALDQRWVWSIWWKENRQGKPKYSEETCRIIILSTINPTFHLGSNPGHCSGKLATNRLN